jgi:hypothetical protein
MSGKNRETKSSFKGTARHGLNCARGMKKWINSEIRGIWTVGYSWFMDEVNKGKR